MMDRLSNPAKIAALKRKRIKRYNASISKHMDDIILRSFQKT
jgi:hypothetical protein